MDNLAHDYDDLLAAGAYMAKRIAQLLESQPAGTEVNLRPQDVDKLADLVQQLEDLEGDLQNLGSL